MITKRNKSKGFVLADVLLAVVVIGITTSSLLLFFSELGEGSKSESVTAVRINDFNHELYFFDPTSIGGGTSGINKTTNLVDKFPNLKEKALNISENIGNKTPEYSIESGLKIYFLDQIISCTKLLSFDLSFIHISTNGTKWFVMDDYLKSIISRKIYCDALPVANDKYKFFFLKN